MSKHTPGPWEAGEQDRVLTGPNKQDYADWYVLAGRHPDDEEGACVASVSADVFGADAEANARLIAAAPDYDAAARKLVAIMESGQVLLRLNDLLAVWNEFRAAIAKAEGKP